MPKYIFRLATLQKVREAKRDRERLALAEAYQAELLLAKRRAELLAEGEALRALQRRVAAGPQLDVNRLLEAQRYELVLNAQVAELARQEALLAAEVERRREMLIEADRDVRVLERLDQRHRQEHRRNEQRSEMKQLDEVAGRQAASQVRQI